MIDIGGATAGKRLRFFVVGCGGGMARVHNLAQQSLKVAQQTAKVAQVCSKVAQHTTSSRLKTFYIWKNKGFFDSMSNK